MDSDRSRFKKIIRGKIKQELKNFISDNDLITRKGEKTVKIPLPQIDVPIFSFGDNNGSGCGNGDGKVGDEAEGQGGEKDGSKGAGNTEGEHSLEMDVSLNELADLLGEELCLPNIKFKGTGLTTHTDTRYSSLNSEGPEALHVFKKTYLEALKRSIVSNEYNSDDPIITPIKADKKYRTPKEIVKPCANAVIIYMMDVSGSMGEEQKEIVRLTSFWIDTWLKRQYKGFERRYIIHDATAKEVDSDVFYRTKESGGTLISSAYKLALDIINRDYRDSDWNIYLFHFSDGDNWSGNDTIECLDLIDHKMLGMVNLFCYGQVESRYGSGLFLRELIKHFGESHDSISLSGIKDKDSIMDALKIFLGKGK